MRSGAIGNNGATSYAPDCVWVDQVQWSPVDGSGYTLTSPEPVPYSWLRQYNLGVARRLYKVYGSETLENGGEWQYPTNALHRFFKVTVEMP